MSIIIIKNNKLLLITKLTIKTYLQLISLEMKKYIQIYIYIYIYIYIQSTLSKTDTLTLGPASSVRLREMSVL